MEKNPVEIVQRRGEVVTRGGEEVVPGLGERIVRETPPPVLSRGGERPEWENNEAIVHRRRLVTEQTPDRELEKKTSALWRNSSGYYSNSSDQDKNASNETWDTLTVMDGGYLTSCHAA